MKQGELTVIIDTVKEAVKFYTEKLAFDVVELDISTDSGEPLLVAACLRKGKSFIRFRLPSIEELAEFSFIKRCASRCVGFSLPFKKGIERYFARCAKKGVKISQELCATGEAGMTQSFVMRDPFGTKIVVFEPAAITSKDVAQDIAAINLPPARSGGYTENEIDNTLAVLKRLGVLRRSGKKYIKLLAKAQ